MPQSNAQRQAKYRSQRPFAGPQGNGERRINCWVSTAAHAALRRLAAHHGLSQREMIEHLLLQADSHISQALELDSAEWQAYFEVGVLRSHKAPTQPNQPPQTAPAQQTKTP
jgi:hypothetical protein